MEIFLKNNRGIALVVVIAVMAILLSITGASLLFSGLNLKAAGNLKTGSGAIHAADAGIQHALAIIPSGANFTYGSGATLVSATPFPDAASGYSYVVTATNNPSTSTNTSTAILTSTATGPNGSKRVVRAYIGRSGSSWTPPSAVYIPGQPQNIETIFNGNSFLVTGNDTNSGGAVGSGPASPLPGIGTTNSGTTDEITNPSSGSLNSSQYNEVTGQGSSPSVATLSSDIDLDQLANNLLSTGVEGVDKKTYSGGTTKMSELGTTPKIFHFTGDVKFICGSGHSLGLTPASGVIIVDGQLELNGYFNFKGLIIARGDRTRVRGYSSVWGALLAKENPNGRLEIDGNSNVYYSSQALNTVMTNWGSAFPQAAKIIAWQEVMQ